MTVDLALVVAFLVGSIAVGRVTRFIVEDDMPVIMWVRRVWDRWTSTSDWNLLLHCVFCAGIWVAAADVAFAFLTDLHWSWWAVNLWLAGAYIGSMIVPRDLPEDQRG